ARELTATWVAELERRQYDVVGDLADLAGPTPTTPFADPDHPDEAQVADAAVDAIRALLLDNARLMRVEADLGGRLEEAQRELERAYLRPTYRLREKTYRRLSGSRAGRGALRVYRRLRGRSS